jgi:hypothetical protein
VFQDLPDMAKVAGGGGGDNSNSQFAILALWAAQRYDIPMQRTLALMLRRYQSSQNADGSWGDPDEENIRTRCHTTWTAIDGLRTYAWRGERLSHPEVKSMLKRWAR